ncbi:MAG: AAA family ATPase [Solobacterium sp.]|nr:AAA family ATPase [Solobacterium sp.]
MTDFFEGADNVSEVLENLTEETISELKETYPETDFYDEKDLIQALDDVYSYLDRQVVIVIDEWDALFRVWRDDKEGQTEYLEFLRNLLKDKSYIALAYMTGILPIKKYGQHSALNMFTEYSMITPRELASYTGFTEEEVRNLCDEYRMDYKEISNWYDGYILSEQIPTDERGLPKR